LGPASEADIARTIHKLTARAAETISKPGRHSDGGGLYLSISAEGRRRWVFLYTWRGRLREAGLGSASKAGVSLKAAREKAAEGRKLVTAGVDPIGEWNKADETEVPTFRRRMISSRRTWAAGATTSTRRNGQ